MKRIIILIACVLLFGFVVLATYTGVLTTHGVLLAEAGGKTASTTAGTSGHVLTSNGASADPTFQAPVSVSPLTTKGDVHTYDTSDARLGVGSDGTVLTADSTQSKGIRWAAASSGDTTAKYIIGATDGTLTNALVWPSLYASAEAPPTSAGTLDDEFDSGSLSGSWTWVNQGGATATVASGFLVLKSPTDASTTFRYIYQAAPSTPWEVTAHISALTGYNSTNWNCGLVLSDSSGKIVFYGPSSNSNLAALNYTNTTTFSSTAATSISNGQFDNIYLRIKDDGANILFSFSDQGHGWYQAYSISRTAFLASGPTRIGLAVDSENSKGVVMECDWFRRTL